MTSTTTPVKQRKLNDLRVADLQRELRSFNVSYDKKELKGSLFEKLRQALLDRNLDPDNYLFDASTDLKTISSDENNRNHDENGSHDTNSLETSTMELDSEQQLHIENTEQTNATSSPPPPPPLNTSTTISTSDDQTNRMDTIDLRQMVDDCDHDNIFLTIDQSTTKHDDECSNDNIDHGLIQVSCSSSDEELDIKTSIHSPTNNTPNKKSLTSTNEEEQIPSDHNHGEDEQHVIPSLPSTTPSSTTTDLRTDKDNISKSETNRQESSDEQQKKTITNKDQCHLWVSNIAKETHASDLKALFSKYGKVLTTKVIGSSSSQWYGYINLASPDDVEKCINALHQTELHGKKIHVDREMHDQTTRSSSSKSKSTSGSTSSNAHKKQSDHSSRQSPSNGAHKKRDSTTNIEEKSSSTDSKVASKKRAASTSNDNKKKLSTSDVNKSNNGDKSVKTHETDVPNKKSTESTNDTRKTTSSSNNSQPSKHHISRTDVPRTNDKSETSHKSTTNNRPNDKNSSKSERSSTDTSKTKISSPISNRSHSSEKRSIPSGTKSDHPRSSSIDKSKQRTSSHLASNRYEKPKETFSKDTHRSSSSSNTFDNDRRSAYQNEQRLRHEKELLVQKQYVQQQEEEKIKEQQRRLAEERERMRREFEFLERERSEIERTRLALEKEKQDQARELGKQQRRLADEAKQRQQQAEAKIRDEKLHRLAHHDSKRPRSSQHDPPRTHYPSTNNGNNNNNNNSSNKGYDHRSSTNTTSGRGRDRSLGDTSRDYYPEPKRQYNNNTNNQREAIFRDRVVYRESDLPSSASGLGLSSSSSSMASTNNNQRYLPSSSTQHRPTDPYNALPQRGRDMALPLSSSVSSAYERSSRNAPASPTNNSAILRRPHSRERFNDREYLQQAQRRDRSPPTTNALRRESMETAHWERPKPRDAAHYVDDTHKYLPNQYLSESSQSIQHQQQQQQQQQQQGLWSAAPPSRQQQQQQQQQQHHHPDLPLKTASHAPVVDPYGWQHVSQQVPPSSHHPQSLPSPHDRSRTNVISNQRIPILSSNQPPPPPPPPSSRGGTTGQTHLYSHPGVPVSSLPTSQQHASLVPPPPPSMHHPTAYITQQAPPPGLVLHPTGQTRAYEQHYVVTQPLPQRRY